MHKSSSHEVLMKQPIKTTPKSQRKGEGGSHVLTINERKSKLWGKTCGEGGDTSTKNRAVLPGDPIPILRINTPCYSPSYTETMRITSKEGQKTSSIRNGVLSDIGEKKKLFSSSSN